VKEKIAILVPAHNEEETIGKVLEEIAAMIPRSERVIVVADDDSSDETVEIARMHTQHVLTSEHNLGVGAQTKKGLRHIAGMPNIRFVIKLDGDGQHKPEFLPKIIQHLDEGYALVICSRFHGLSDQTDTPTDRILLNMIFTEMMRKITGWEITDARSGYMGFCLGYAKQLAEDLIIPGYGIPMEIILRIWNAGRFARVVEIPHPAVYHPGISDKLDQKYSSEKVQDKASRLEVAYQALLLVIEDLGISREQILEMNGYATTHV
jgi:glycosyltransferase involved in cell wall biosynthesis